MGFFDLKMGFSCNNDCIHCVVEEKRETSDLTTEEIKRIIDSRPISDDIGFTGGEPTIRKDLVELMKYAKERGHRVFLQTNGTGFSNENMAREASKYIDSVLIAIHSCDEQVHDHIVKGNGMFKKTIQGFDNLIKYNIPHETQTVISKLNANHLVDTYSFIQEKSPGTIMNMTYPHPNGNAYKNWKIVAPQYSEIKKYIHQALDKFAPLIRTEAIPICYLYPYQDKVFFNFDEPLLTKVDNRSGIDPSNKNITYFDEDGITEDYFSSMLSERRKGPKCRECIFNDRCAGVWKEYVEFYSQNFDLFPIKEIKEEKKVEQKEKAEIDKKFSQKSGSLIIYGKDQCMNRCMFCSGSSGFVSDEEKWNTAIEDINYFVDNGVGIIEISGGDPGEYDRIVDIVKYMKSSGIMYIQLSTHGRTLKDEKLVKDLKEAGLDSVKIPLYGVTEEIHNMCVQFDKNISKGNAFEDTVEGIKNSRKHGLLIYGYIVPNQFNKHQLTEIVDLYMELAGEYLFMLHVGLGFIAQKDYNYTNAWFLPLKDLGPFIKPLKEKLETLHSSININILDVPYCVMGGYTPLIENKLESFPNLGNHDVEEENRSEISPKIPHYRIKAYADMCNNCIYKCVCGGFPKNELEMFGTIGLKPFSEEVHV